MRRLLRWVFNGLTALSAVLFVATCVLWVRSYHRIDGFIRDTSYGYAEYFSNRGGLWVGRMIHRLPAPRSGFRPFAESEGNQRASQTFLIFGDCRNRFGFGSSYCIALEANFKADIYTIPLWTLCVVLVVMPVMRCRLIAVAMLRRSRQLCPACGYDLRATPDRCPECGSSKHKVAK